MKFCFSTYSSVLLKCTKPSVTQKDFVTTLLYVIDSDYSSYYLDDSAISNFVRGAKNLSPEICIKARCCKASDVADYFNENVIPLLNQNKKGNLVLAMKDLIASDTDIESNTVVEYVSRQTKADLLKNNSISLDAFLGGLFLYCVVDTRNKGTTAFVKAITEEYIASFDDKKQMLHFSADETVDLPKTEISGNASEYSIDEDTMEEARIFCIEHEKDLHLLPICEMASILNPRHKHISPMINAFNRKKSKLQKAILVSEEIKPYEHCTWDSIDECLKAFEKEIKERKYHTVPFLYDGAKYFHGALKYYSDYVPDEMNPYHFKKKYVSELFPNVFSDLRGYIDDYDYGLENFPEDNNPPPFDLVWYGYDLANCDEKTVVFWVNRFIVTVCHYLHGFDLNAEYDEKWKYKDIVDESKLSTMEDLYYYALFLLYESYSDENGGGRAMKPFQGYWKTGIL